MNMKSLQILGSRVLVLVVATLTLLEQPDVCSGQQEPRGFIWSDTEDSWHYWWAYSGISGPEYWGNVNPDWFICNKGRRQSPINIDTKALLYDPRLTPLELDNNLISGLLYNDGHAIVFNTSALAQLNRSVATENNKFDSPDANQANSTRKRQIDAAPHPPADLVEVGPLKPLAEDASFDNMLSIGESLSSSTLIGIEEAADNSLISEEKFPEPVEIGIWSQVHITGAELASTFTFEAFYLKFGKYDASGSEHQVDSKSYAGELQLLAYNSELYKSYSEASTQPHGLVIVAVLMALKPETNNKSNPNDNPAATASAAYLEANILSRLHEINHKGYYAVVKALNLSALIPETSQFITYEGSLSKPGCHESAQWFLLNTPLYITKTNLEKLRLISASDKKNQPSGTFIAGNIRPIQAVFNRPVRTNIRPPSINKNPESCKMVWPRYEYISTNRNTM